MGPNAGFQDRERELSLLDSFDYLQPTPYAPDSEAVRVFARDVAVRGDAMATARAALTSTAISSLPAPL